MVVSVNNNFINYIFFIFLVLVFLISNCNRDFANRNNVSQNAIFTLGFLFGIVNGSSRFLWGYLMDKFGFKTLMFAITIMEVTVGISLFFVVNVSFLFVICVLCIGACIGGNFVILAPTFNKIFGLQTGPELYGITSISIGMANLSGPIMTKFILNENKDYLIAFLIGAALSFAKFIILFFFKEEQYEFKNK